MDTDLDIFLSFPLAQSGITEYILLCNRSSLLFYASQSILFIRMVTLMFKAKKYSPLFIEGQLCVRLVLPNIFGARDWFRGRQFFHGQGGGLGVGGWWFRWWWELWEAADEASLTRLPLTSCHVARFLTGCRPVSVHGPGVGDPWVRYRATQVTQNRQGLFIVGGFPQLKQLSLFCSLNCQIWVTLGLKEIFERISQNLSPWWGLTNLYI